MDMLGFITAYFPRFKTTGGLNLARGLIAGCVFLIPAALLHPPFYRRVGWRLAQLRLLFCQGCKIVAMQLIAPAWITFILPTKGCQEFRPHCLALTGVFPALSVESRNGIARLQRFVVPALNGGCTKCYRTIFDRMLVALLGKKFDLLPQLPLSRRIGQQRSNDRKAQGLPAGQCFLLTIFLHRSGSFFALLEDRHHGKTHS